MRALRWAIVAALVSGPASALACQIYCTNQVVDGASTVATYPATVQFQLNFTIEPGGGDFLVEILSSVMPPDFFDGQQVPSYYPGVPVMNHEVQASPTFDYSLLIPSYEACLAMPGAILGTDGSVTLANVVTAENYFPSNEPPTCAADIVCLPPPVEEAGPTRTPGWWKNRVDALSACVAGGVNLGYATITDVRVALGLLWADEGLYTGLDKARLKLAKHTLVAYCNSSLLGAVPGDFSIADAVSLLGGTNCAGMLALYGTIDEFNNRFDDVALPAGFNPGPSYGVTAKNMAILPAFPAGTCSE